MICPVSQQLVPYLLSHSLVTTTDQYLQLSPMNTECLEQKMFTGMWAETLRAQVNLIRSNGTQLLHISQIPRSSALFNKDSIRRISISFVF